METQYYLNSQNSTERNSCTILLGVLENHLMNLKFVQFEDLDTDLSTTSKIHGGVLCSSLLIFLLIKCILLNDQSNYKLYGKFIKIGLVLFYY